MTTSNRQEPGTSIAWVALAASLVSIIIAGFAVQLARSKNAVVQLLVRRLDSRRLSTPANLPARKDPPSEREHDRIIQLEEHARTARKEAAEALQSVARLSKIIETMKGASPAARLKGDGRAPVSPAVPMDVVPGPPLAPAPVDLPQPTPRGDVALQLLPQAWSAFFTEDGGRHIGKLESLSAHLSRELGAAFHGVSAHPEHPGIAVVVVHEATGDCFYAVPLQHSYGSVSPLFESSTGSPVGRIVSLERAARLEAGTLEIIQLGGVRL
ncbi:MAG: hypothetical protein ACYC8T_37135 [Myxococcaceae bacterium]